MSLSGKVSWIIEDKSAQYNRKEYMAHVQVVPYKQKNHHILRYDGKGKYGGEGGRTPVRKPENPSISERSLCFDIPSAVRPQTDWQLQ